MTEPIVTLGLEVDARPIRETEQPLTTFVQKVGEAEAATESLKAASREAAAEVERSAVAKREAATTSAEAVKRAAQEEAAELERMSRSSARAHENYLRDKAKREERAAIEAAEAARTGGAERAAAEVQGLQAGLAKDLALIREAQLRGFLTPAEAAQQGRAAAEAYNQSLLGVIDNLRTTTGKEAPDGLNAVVGSMVNIEQASGRAAAGTGRLNQALLSLLRQSTDTSPAVAQVTNALGGLALGSGVMVGVLAGGAALSALFTRMTEGSRELRLAQEEATESLEEFLERRRVATLGPGGVESELVDTERGKQERLLEEIRAVESALAVSGVTGIDSPRLVSLRREYAESIELARNAEREIAAIRIESAEGSSDSILRAAMARQEEYRSGIAQAEANRIAAIENAKRALAEEVSLISNALSLGIERQNLQQDALRHAERLRDIAQDQNRSLGEQVAAQRELNGLEAALLELKEREDAKRREAFLDTLSVQRIAPRLSVSGAPVPDAVSGIAQVSEEVARASREDAESAQRAWLAAIDSIGQGLGGVAQQMAGIAQAGLRVDTNADGKSSLGFDATSAGIAAIPAFLGAAFDAFSGSGRRRRKLEAARDAWQDSLDSFADALTDQSRIERIRSEAADHAEALTLGLFDTESGAALGGKAILPNDHRSTVEGFLEAGDVDAALQYMESIGIGTGELAEALAKSDANIKRIRDEEIAGIEETEGVRALRLAGLDHEADLKQQGIENQRRVTDAMALFGDELSETEQAVLDQILANNDLSISAIHAAEAIEKVIQAFNARQDSLSWDARGRRLEGDDRGGLELDLQRDVERQLFAEREKLNDGRIDEIEFLRRTQIILGEANKGLADFDEVIRRTAEASAEAARQEAFRAEQDERRLDSEIARAQGNDLHALTLDQMARLDDALNDGRSESYVRKLNELFAIQRENLLRVEQDRLLRTSAESTAALSRELTGFGRALNAPDFFRPNANRYRSLDPGYGGGGGGGGNQVVLNFGERSVVIPAAPGVDGAQLFNEFLGEARRRAAAGVPEPFFVGPS